MDNSEHKNTDEAAKDFTTELEKMVKERTVEPRDAGMEVEKEDERRSVQIQLHQMSRVFQDAAALAAQGKGIASEMCKHSQAEAISMGFRAMQFNLVVSTNQRAVRLWRKLGFSVVGTLPRSFRHLHLGYVDALVMFKELST